MNSTWSVFTVPYLVFTVQPSTKRQQVALYALTRHIGAHGLLAAGDFVDFVDEYDAVLFGILDRPKLQFLFVDHFRRFLVDQELQRLLDLDLAAAGAAAA